jgi:hypothetical protein
MAAQDLTLEQLDALLQHAVPGVVNRSKGLRQAIAEHARLLVELGSAISAQERVNLVRGRLILNTIRGIDKGASSAKVLGSEKRVSMWQSDTQRGLVILNSPTGELGNKEHLLGTDAWKDSTIRTAK